MCSRYQFLCREAFDRRAVAVAKRIARAVSLARIRNPGLGPTSKLTMSIGASASNHSTENLNTDSNLSTGQKPNY